MDFTLLIKNPAVLTCIAGIVIITIITLLTNKPAKKPVVNLKIKKEEAKVVDVVPCGEIENLAEFKDGKLVMCRCWRSDKFPYCDGSHVKHNAETGDNVGPLIIKK